MRRFLERLGIGKAPPADALPWLRPPSIAQHIRAHLDPATRRLRPEGLALPDEAALVNPSGLRWAAGAKDGVFGRHLSGSANRNQAQVIVGHLLAIAERDSRRRSWRSTSCCATTPCSTGAGRLGLRRVPQRPVSGRWPVR